MSFVLPQIYGKKRAGDCSGGKETVGERGEGSGGEGLVSQPLFCPFDGCWMGKDPPVLWGQVLCVGIWGGRHVRWDQGAGGEQGLPPQPQA